MVSQLGSWIGSVPRKSKKDGRSAGVRNVKEADVLRKMTARGYPQRYVQSCLLAKSRTGLSMALLCSMALERSGRTLIVAPSNSTAPCSQALNMFLLVIMMNPAQHISLSVRVIRFRSQGSMHPV